MNKVIIKRGQNMLDATLLLTGDMNAAMNVALTNGKSLTDDLLVDEVINHTSDMGVLQQEISQVLIHHSIATAL